MKKIVYSMFLAASLVAASCSSSDDSKKTGEEGFSNDPVSGVIYSESFTLGGGRARSVMANGVDSFYIYLNENAITCDEEVSNPVWIIVPAEVGSYDKEDADMNVQLRDSNGESFESVLDAKVEITEITETMVKGKVMATGFYEDENKINGTFAVQYCPL